jgi:hypothetical protein
MGSAYLPPLQFSFASPAAVPTQQVAAETPPASPPPVLHGASVPPADLARFVNDFLAAAAGELIRQDFGA